MNDHHDEKKSPIEAEGDCSVCKGWKDDGALHEGIADLIANVDESIHDFVKAMGKLQERCEALESLVRDMYGAWCATVDDCYAQNIDGYYERMAELGIEVSE